MISDAFLCIFFLTFTIFSQAVLSDKKSFQQERLCIMRLLFTKAASGWHESNPPPALSAQPYCNTIWNSCLSWIWCFFLSVEACCLFCISLHTIWAICLPLTSFRVNMTHLSLSCPSTRNWDTISFYFSAKSIALPLCRSTAVEIFNITNLFLSCQSARNWNTISISSLVFLFYGLSRYSPSIHIVLHWYWFVLYSAISITTLRFSKGKTRCLFTILNILFVHYFEYSVCANILLSLDVCSLLRIFCFCKYSFKPWCLFTISKILFVQ